MKVRNNRSNGKRDEDTGLSSIFKGEIGYDRRGNVLSISAGKADWRFQKEPPLPEPVEWSSASFS